MRPMAGKQKKVTLLALALCMALCCAPASAAGEASFRLDMDNLNLQKGVSCNIILSLVNAQEAENIRIEGLEHFDVLSQSQSTSTSVVGSEVTYQIDYYLTVMPKTAGQFTLKALIEYGGKTYETNTLEVTVGEGSANAGQAAPDLFVETILSQADAYLGEKVVVTYMLYSRYSIDNFGFTDYTAIDGVIAKDTPADQLKAEYVYIDGVRYAKYEAKQLILDPIKAGTQTIPSFTLQVNVITEDGLGGMFSGPMSGFSGLLSQVQPMYLQTDEITLAVKPLPTEGKPADFSGIVGELQIDGHYSREALTYGDSLSLQVTASGSCNLDGMKEIFAGELPGFSVYETQKSAVESVENGQYYAQKEFEAILVPEQNGAINIAPVSISYFSPVTGQYERAEIPGADIEVLGDMPQPAGGAGSQPATVETVDIQQVNYADAGDGYFTVQIKKQVLYGLLIGLGALLVLATILKRLVSHRRKQDQTLKSLYRQLMTATDTHEVYDLFSAIIKHCFGLSIKASSQSAVSNSLPDPALAARVADIMGYMESQGDKGCAGLKEQIRGVYGMIVRMRRKPLARANA